MMVLRVYIHPDSLSDFSGEEFRVDAGDGIVDISNVATRDVGRR